MLFDRFCGIIERHYPALIPIIRHARLFWFDGEPSKVLPKSYTTEEAEMHRAQFFLPFPTIAIEDTGTCVFLWDAVKQQAGLGNVRYFIDCLPLRADAHGFREDERDVIDAFNRTMNHLRGPEGVLPFGDDACCISIGKLRDIILPTPDSEQGTLYMDGEVDVMFVADKNYVYLTPKEYRALRMGASNPRDYDAPAIRNAAVAMQEVMYFNSPGRFVVERMSSRARKLVGKPRSNKAPKILRGHERACYTLLTPHAARAMMGLLTPGQGHASPTPHERRRHYRTYTAERYKKMKGQRVTIPATWVGPSEATVGKHRYKVMLGV